MPPWYKAPPKALSRFKPGGGPMKTAALFLSWIFCAGFSFADAPQSTDADAQQLKWAEEGFSLSQGEPESLEKALQKNPRDLSARIKLLVHYYGKSLQGQSADDYEK